MWVRPPPPAPIISLPKFCRLLTGLCFCCSRSGPVCPKVCPNFRAVSINTNSNQQTWFHGFDAAWSVAHAYHRRWAESGFVCCCSRLQDYSLSEQIHLRPADTQQFSFAAAEVGIFSVSDFDANFFQRRGRRERLLTLSGPALDRRRCVVRPGRFERPTFCSGGKRSIQLSYGRTESNIPSVAKAFRDRILAPRPSARLHPVDAAPERPFQAAHADRYLHPRTSSDLVWRRFSAELAHLQKPIERWTLHALFPRFGDYAPRSENRPVAWVLSGYRNIPRLASFN